MRRSPLLIAVLVFGLTQNAKADIITYEFRGVLSPGSSSHTGILDGESWTASFLINDAVSDTVGDPGSGEYPNSVLSARVDFSGGFTKELAFEPRPDQFGVSVLNNADFGGTSYDGVGVFLANGAASINASVVSTDDDTFLSSDALPLPGVSFIGDIGTFDFVDDSGESVSFFSSSNDVSFTASVPEPDSFGLLALLGLGAVWRKRRTGLRLR